MAPTINLLPIMIGPATVDQGQIIDELDIARLKLDFELETWVVRKKLQHIHCPFLTLGQFRQFGKPLSTAHETRIVAHVHSGLGRNEDGHRKPRILSFDLVAAPI